MNSVVHSYLYVTKIREEQQIPDWPALLVMDNFSGQTKGSILEQLIAQRIMVVFVPPNTTDKLQSLYLSANERPRTF